MKKVAKKGVDNPKAKWFLTWNNYTDDDRIKFEEWCNENCKKAAVQPEKGESGTPHLQGCISLIKKIRFEQLRRMWPGVAWYPTKDEAAAIKYCTKEETRDGEGFTIGIKKPVKDPLENKEPLPWQKEIIEMIKTEADDRRINWFFDKKGGVGKTSIAKHMCIKYPKNILYVGGKSNDIKFGVKSFLDNPKNELLMCIFDFTRSIEGFVSFEAIEAIKNGIFYNTKYESGMVVFNSPHIIIFANFEPDKSKLSEDRWNIKNIEKIDEEIEEIDDNF